MYCSQCGFKNGVGSKFCSSCGTALMTNVQQPQIRKQIQTTQKEVDEDGLPTSVVRPRRLEYEIERPEKNKFLASEIINSPPSSEKFSRPRGNVSKLTKEEYLSQSLKECAPSKNFKEINEA